MTRFGVVRRGGKSGATALEFAVVLPVLLLLESGVIELGRMAWIIQTLSTVGQTTARCVAIGSGACTSGTTYATNLANSYGVTLDSSNVTVATVSAATIPAPKCVPPNANTMVQVSINLNFISPLAGFAPWLSNNLTTFGCYPVTGT